MSTNLGVKALLSWVNSMKLSDKEISMDDLQDGTLLLRLVDKLRKAPGSRLSNSPDERFRVIADFVETECRFSPTEGASLSWDNITDGINLTVEIAKVLLLLAYHDMMNDRCTLNMLDCDVERELANLTSSFVMESQGYVYLSNGLDAYLTRRYLSVSREIFKSGETTSPSSVSTMSSLSDDESPVFRHTQKVKFLDMQTVASSSVSKSPLEDIMNTPKFQMRKMQRQMIKERDYRDGLERELASKLALITQRESQINQLQYCLDKLKEGQGDQEQVTRDQINELETRNDTLQMRLNEMLKQNKDLRSSSSLMERKVDQLTDENGLLSSEMRAACSQLAIFESEVGRLTETQASAQEEWKSKTNHLQSELNQATAQKDLLTEQIQILQGKISCLEDEISRATKEEVGENMGPVMEREMWETEISGLKTEMESTVFSLRKAEVEIQIKTQQLAEYQQEITQHQELLEQQRSQTEAMMQAKDEVTDKLQKEITEQRAVLQQEIWDLKLRLEHAEQQNTEQVTRLQQRVAACEQEVEKLKGIKKEKEDLLHQTEEEVKNLETQLSAATSLLADKDEQISSLQEDVDMLTGETQKHKDEIQAKEGALAKLLLEKSHEQQVLHCQIQTLTGRVGDLSSTLTQAEQELQLKQDLLAKTQRENVQQREVLQHQLSTNEEQVHKLNAEIQEKNEQLVMLQSASCQQCETLEQEIEGLKGQLEHLNDSLTKAEEQVLNQQVMLTKQQQESAHQRELLQQQLSASEEEVRRMKEEIQAKEEQMHLLKADGSEQAALLHQEIQDLKKQVECLSSSLGTAEENLQSKENLLAEQQLQSTQHMETLQTQMMVSQDEGKRLNAEVHVKEEQLAQLKTRASAHSELLQQEIEGLNEKIQSMSSSLEITKDRVQAKEDLMAKQEQEHTLQIEELGKHSAVLEEEVKQLREEIQTKEGEVDMLRVESCKASEVLQVEIQTLRDQVQHLSDSLKTAAEQVQATENLLNQKEAEISQGKDAFENMMTTSEEEMRKLREEIQAKEDQLATLQKEGSVHSDMLQQEITRLKEQLDQMGHSLTEAEEKVQTQLVTLDEQQQESAHQRELLQQQLSASEEEVRRMEEEIQAKEEQMHLLKADGSEQAGLLHEEIQCLKKQVETLGSSLRKAEEDVQSKDGLLSQQQQENTQQREVLQSLQQQVQQVEVLQKQITSREEEAEKLKESQSEKESLLLKAGEKLQILQTELSDVKTLMADKDQNLNALREEVAAQANVVQKTKEEAEATEKILAELKEGGSKQADALQRESQILKGEVETISLKLLAKEQKLLETQQESAQQVNLLQQQITSVNAELSQQKETHAASLRLQQVATLEEKEALVQEKEVLLSRILQAEKDRGALQERIEAVVFEKERLAQANQAIERENAASRKLESVLQQELEILRMEKLLKDREKAEEIEVLERDLQQQLAAKSEAVDHYKAQMENAVSHYNGKKQLLQKSQEEGDELKHSLEVKDREIKAITMEKKLLQLDLEKAQSNERKLSGKVASLEAQLACADQTLRVQNKIHSNGGSASESCYFTQSGVGRRAGKRTMSSDSLDQSSLDDSLNSTRKLSAPESSTPLVRSSERLAAKRRGLQAESLETLYFTPINTRQTNRTSAEDDVDPDSTCRNPTSSVKRRRTTQVINITLTKKTPGRNEGDETFYSLASARSQPNLSTAHSARPVSMEVFDTPAKMTGAASDQLIGLPGYRRSTIHSHATSTFCVGAENEPEGAPEDWLRIAELQARNKACLPHLKSSYPVESETGRGGALIFTDEDLRTGDPSDTIRRASMMPGQLQDSLVSHRYSMMVGQAGAAAGTRSHRLSLMPGQLPSKTVSSSQQRSPKRTSTLSVHQTSPEKKMKASCFPRPLTPKNKNVCSGPSSSHLHPVLSPANRRESMMFCIENTPRKNNYLRKGLNKLRSSTRKSPGNSSKKSPAQVTSARKCKENVSSGTSRAGVGRAGRLGSSKSSQVATKGVKKSPQAASRSAKSPGLTASARKMMGRLQL